MLVIVRVFRESRWLFVRICHSAFLDLFSHGGGHLASNYCSLLESCCAGHYCFILLIPLEVREAGGWDGRQSGQDHGQHASWGSWPAALTSPVLTFLPNRTQCHGLGQDMSRALRTEPAHEIGTEWAKYPLGALQPYYLLLESN